LSVGLWLIGLASLLVLSGMVIRALEMVKAGRGLETFRTAWLVEDNSIGFLVFVAAALLALVVGLALSLSRFIKRRSYERVHGISPDSC
jgi:hypothetical protein